VCRTSRTNAHDLRLTRSAMQSEIHRRKKTAGFF
jgi:hypothetical protein